MGDNKAKKVITDFDIKKKAVKLVIVHLKKKIPKDYAGSDLIMHWMEEMQKVLDKPEFVASEYYEMRKNLNDIIERTLDEETRFKLRDSWYSFGKALDKKVKQNY